MKKKVIVLFILAEIFLSANVFAVDGLIPRFAFEPCDIGFKRPARPRAYFDKAGRKFAIMGWESGGFEAWAYPLKILRNFEFSFLRGTSSQPIRGRDIVLSTSVTPAETTLTFVYQSFTVQASFLTAVDEPGAVILLVVDTTEPLTIICGFLPILQPMWPAGLGALEFGSLTGIQTDVFLAAAAGYTALMANVQHTFDNALGSVTELFSGHQNIWPAEAVAHQGFSSGGVVLPLVKGVLGLDGDAAAKAITFEPRFPAHWPSASVQGVRMAEASFDLSYFRKDVGLRVEVRSREAKGWTMALSPALGPAVRVRRARLNGKDIPFREVRTERAVKPVVRFALSGEDRVDFVLKPAVEVVPPYMFSEAGDLSRGLRIIDLTGDEHRLHLLLEGLAGESYYLSLQNSHLVDSVKGAVLENGRLKITFPAAAKPGYVEQKVVLLCR